MNKKTFIFDLDGTLADVSARRAELDAAIAAGGSRNKALTRFNSADAILTLDRPNAPVCAVFAALQAAGHECFVVSARQAGNPEKAGKKDYPATEAQTLAQLAGWGVVPAAIYLRARGDGRPDAEFKKALLARLREEGREIEAAFDDQTAIVAVWREAGITCFDCAGYTRADK